MRQAINFIARALWRWDVTAVGSTLIYGFGVGAMYGDDYIVAGMLYFAGTAWITARILAREETKTHPQRGLVSIGILMVATFILDGSGFWIRHRAIMHAAEKREAFARTKNEPEEKKEPPKTENLPARTKKSEPAFAVQIESLMASQHPQKNETLSFFSLQTLKS